jgi:head-tail adaptor
MNAGLMDTIITVESPTFTDSAYGKANKPTGYTTARRIWGRVQYNGGSEGVAADKAEFSQTVTVTVHYQEGKTIAVTDRLVFNAAVWNIKSIAQVNRRQYLRLEAENVS